MKRLLPLLLLLASCSAAPRSVETGLRLNPVPPGQNLPDYAKRPFEPFSRTNAVGIAQREWRAFGSVMDDAPPGTNPLSRVLRPDQQPGLWQRVGDYWWSGQDAGTRETGWTSRYDESGTAYQADAPAWSAAFISYVLRTAGAGTRFPSSPLHADYINAAAQGSAVLHAEPPDQYPPQPGDLICTGRANARGIRFQDLPAGRFFGHCDLVVDAAPGQITVIGGNVSGGVTMKHVPITLAGTLAGPDGEAVDPRYSWFVALRVLYDI